MKRKKRCFFNYTLTLALIISALFACDMRREVENNPVPTLTSIFPTSRASQLPSFTLRVNGTGFTGGSRIVFNGMEKRTTYVNAAQLSCTITPADVNENSSGSASTAYLAAEQNRDFDVLVRNPAPGGGDSDTLTFSIQNNHIFHEPVVISDQAVNLGTASFAVGDSQHLYAAWAEDSSGFYGEIAYIFFSRSTDGGKTWSQPVKILSQSGRADTVTIAIHRGSGTLYAIWRDCPGEDRLFYFSRSTDSGETWDAAREIPVASYVRTMVVDDSGDIYLLWVASHTGSSMGQVFVSRSSDRGLNWDAPVQVSDNNEEHQVFVKELKAAFNENGETYILWNINYYPAFQTSIDGTIHFVRSTGNNGEWTQPEKIYDWRWPQSPGTACSKISLDVDGPDNVYVTFGEFNFYFIYSTDNGVTWSEPAQLSDNPNGHHIKASSMAVDTMGNINVIYFNYDGMNFRRSMDNGLTWTEPLSYPHGSCGIHNFRTTLDDEGNIYTIWNDRTIDFDLVFTNVLYFTSTLR